jgi:glycosyltransferase involved in cell wall biosynthesis
MKKKSVLINASMLSAKPSGVGIYGEQVVPRLIKQLEANGIEYACFSYEDIGVPNFHKIKFPLGSFFKRSVSVSRLIWNIFYLPRIAKNFDLVYSFSTHGSPFLSNQLITVHDLISLNYPNQHKFQTSYFRNIVPRILNKCRGIIAISNFTKNEVLKHYPDIDSNKIAVVYNGADHLYGDEEVTTANQSQLNDLTGGKPYFLTVGAAYSHKNIEVILAAAKSFADSHAFIIIGRDTGYFNKLKQNVADKALTNVVFMDYIESGFLKLLYTKAIANLYVSLYEGFGLTPLEASYFDCISIVSNTSSLPEIYGDAVIYVDPASPDDLIEKINTVISPAFKKDEYLQKLNRLHTLYTWDACCTHIFSIINNLLNGN